MGKTHEKNGLPAYLNPPAAPEMKTNLQVDGSIKCDHKFVHLDTMKRENSESYLICYKRTDYFFCEKCLEEKQIVKTDHRRYGLPDWY